MREQMKTNEVKMDDNLDANKEKLDANLKEIIAEMWPGERDDSPPSSDGGLSGE
jgi:hypothetical protein